jgi:hypothetical protein
MESMNEPDKLPDISTNIKAALNKIKKHFENSNEVSTPPYIVSKSQLDWLQSLYQENIKNEQTRILPQSTEETDSQIIDRIP